MGTFDSTSGTTVLDHTYAPPNEEEAALAARLVKRKAADDADMILAALGIVEDVVDALGLRDERGRIKSRGKVRSEAEKERRRIRERQRREAAREEALA